MTFDDEQCPKRGPGLTHVAADGGTNCSHCGAWRVNAAPTSDEPNVIVRLANMFGPWFPNGIVTPRVVKVSGEDPQIEAVEEEKLGDFAALTPREWHALVIERAHHEGHACDDR